MSQVMGVVSTLAGIQLLSTAAPTKRSCCRPPSACRTHCLTVCQLDDDRDTEFPAESTRRSLLLAAAAAASAFVAQPNAQAKRKPPTEKVEKQPEDEKNLSAYDARLLANARRKEALKVLVEAQKAKAKLIQPVAKPPAEIY